MNGICKASLLLLLALARAAHASDILDCGPLTDRIVLVHFKDGYVIHHKRGEARTHETVITDPLDTAAAENPASYTIESPDDPALKSVHPTDVGRKSKGTDFAWHVDRWVDNHAVNDAPDHTDEHWLYLFLPAPMHRGKTYAVHTGGLAKNGHTWKFLFDESRNRSEAVHVNIIGYVPSAPAKYAYLYHWAGDKGGLDFNGYRQFRLIDLKTDRTAFAGQVRFRKKADNPETGQANNTPNANFLDADVYECDFSPFRTPGRYVVSVDGVGCSFPFEIGADVYRRPFRILARGLYMSRSGIALTDPYTSFHRPAPHNPNLTPGFKGKLQYSTMRYLDYGSESGTADQIRPTLKGPLDAWGWYQDAGDWDSYVTHLRVAQELLLAYELNPKAFRAGELNIPESGDGIPDILNEAAWLPRFCYRLRHELMAKRYGTGGLGLRIDGDPFGDDTKPGGIGQGSWEDVNRIWVASGEDPVSTIRYAGVAAQLAYALRLAGKSDPQKVDWAKEARECYDWAIAHTLPKDENDIKIHRIYASAALFRLTGDPRYQSQLDKDTADLGPNSELWAENIYGPALFALGGMHDSERDPAILSRLRTAVLHTAALSDETAAKRALRWGGSYYMPMLVGQQTTPMVMELAVARKLLERSDPATASRYTADLFTTCDYFLGTNALNMTWVTGLGVRHPMQVFHMDSWYVGDGKPRDGIIPYGPWIKQHDEAQGPWDSDWANKTVYPPIDQWPGNERYFENRCCPLTNEFTIHQNIAPAAAIFGILCGA